MTRSYTPETMAFGVKSEDVTDEPPEGASKKKIVPAITAETIAALATSLFDGSVFVCRC
jgi:hypothetical protein